jgi:hypothetical protein
MGDGCTAAPKLLQSIKDRLILHGDRKNVDARTAENVLGALHVEAWNVATKTSDRALDRAGFLRLFDQNTRVSLPSTTADALLGLATTAILQEPLAIERSIVVVDPPPLPERYYPRSTVLDAITAATQQRTVIALYGGTGMGKTTAAAAHCANAPTKWGWIDLRGYDAQRVAPRLLVAGAQAERSREPLPLVLDDLEGTEDPRPYEGSIRRLVATQRHRGAALIVTATHELPSRLCQALGIDVQDIIRMPPFDRQEIVGFLARRGCEAEWRDALAGIIELTTQGHPQLVHARVAALELAGFPQPSVEDLTLTPPDVLDARAEARRLISQLQPSERDLIYRLSLTANLMDRDRLMAIAVASPPISEPGNAIDRLVGPWIEILSRDIFRVSPLVKSAGQEVNGSAWAPEMHGSIARAFLSRRSLTPSDISEILFHATAASQGDLLVRLSFGLMRADMEAWRAIADGASWFAMVGTQPGATLPVTSQGDLFLVRLMQYRIAASGEGLDDVRAITARFDEEFAQSATDTTVRIARFLFLNEVILRAGLKYPINEIVVRSSQYISLADELADVLATISTPACITDGCGHRSIPCGSSRRRPVSNEKPRVVGPSAAATI